MRYTPLRYAQVGVGGGLSGGPGTIPGPVEKTELKYSFELEEKALAGVRRWKLKKEEEKREAEAKKRDAAAKLAAVNAAKAEGGTAEPVAVVSQTPAATTVTAITVEPILVDSKESLDSTVPIVEVQVVPLANTNPTQSVNSVSPVVFPAETTSTVTRATATIADTKSSEKDDAEFLRSLPGEQVKSIETFAGIANYHNAKKTKALLEACGWNISVSNRTEYQVY
uniref:Uncharacterized protein n=1 Tax=Lotharella globosa TaxID=91324 RepID=A0A6V3J0X9_9EUKA